MGVSFSKWKSNLLSGPRWMTRKGWRAKEEGPATAPERRGPEQEDGAMGESQQPLLARSLAWVSLQPGS